MNRKPEVLLPVEIEILSIAAVRSARRDAGFHGYELRKELVARGRRVSKGGTYQALDRLESRRFLRSAWERGPSTARGPRRRLYQLTTAGSAALEGIADTLPSGRVLRETPA